MIPPPMIPITLAFGLEENTLNQFNHLPFENPNLTDLVAHLHDYLMKAGYQHIQVPAISEASTFLQKAGDQISSSLFLFERFGKELALRPEFTALAVKRYVENFSQHPVHTVVRWQMYGSVFLDHSFSFQNYQHMSLGAELIGMGGILADAEILACAVESLKPYINQPIVMSVGHVGLMEAILSHYGIDGYLRAYILNHLTQLVDSDSTFVLSEQFNKQMNMTTGHIERDDMLQMLDLVLDASEYGATMGGRSRMDIATRLAKQLEWKDQLSMLTDLQVTLREVHRIDGVGLTVLHHLMTLLKNKGIEVDSLMDVWENTLKTAESLGVSLADVHITPLLNRNWNYYTGMVFDISINDQTVASGGRYDDLCKLLGSPVDIPAVGFAFFIDSLTRVIEREQYAPSTQIALLVDTNSLLDWVKILRDMGWTVCIYPKSIDLSSISSALVLELSEDGSIHYDNQSYSLNTASELVTAIETASRYRGEL